LGMRSLNMTFLWCSVVSYSSLNKSHFVTFYHFIYKMMLFRKTWIEPNNMFWERKRRVKSPRLFNSTIKLLNEISFPRF
jgi:hypothetical protein